MFCYKIFGPDGRCMMSTTSRACTYPAEMERAMKRAGYKIKITDDAPDDKAAKEANKCKN